VIGRRLLVVCAVLMGLSILAASVQPPRVRVDDPAVAPSASPVSPEQADGRSVTLEAEGDRRRVVVELGRPLHLEVSSRSPAAVQIGPEGPVDSADAGSPARFDLLMDQPGTLEVALLDPRRVIARITTRR
jgi:hypothetical protein